MSEDRQGQRLRWAVAAALALATALLFWRATGNGFVNYDDPDYVTENRHVQGGLGAAGVRWALGAREASNWHPLTWMSHMLDWSLYGAQPRGHHATSVLLHAANAALAFAALWRLTRAMWPSALVAAWFAWHPLRVESVAWVAERKDVLSGCFWFLVLWAYAIYAERRQAGRGAWRWYILAWVGFALGLMAKPMLVTLPCVLLLLDVWPLRRLPMPGTAGAVPPAGGRLSWAGAVAEKLPFFLLVVLSAAVTYTAQREGGSVSAALGLGARVANALVAVAAYLRKLVWPSDLAVLYPHPGYWPAAAVAGAAVLVAALTALAWQQRRVRPWLAVGWLWFLGTLVPVSGLVQVGLQSMADRYTYLPMLGVQLAAVWTLHEALTAPALRRAAAVAAGVVLGAYALSTWELLPVWRDSRTLFDRAIAVTKNNYVAHDNRGLHLFKSGRIDEGIADYRRALALNPAYLNANNNLGHALAQLGRPAEAIPYYEAAYRAQPTHLEVRNNLANALSDVGQLDAAMQHYDYVLARAPQHANALNGSGVALAMRGRPAEARERIERSLQIAPDNPNAHNNLANVYAMLGRPDDAIRAYRRAAELDPSNGSPLLFAGMLLVQQEKFAEAVPELQRCLARRAENAEAHAYLGLALARLGRRDEARQALRTALQQKPDHAAARQWLAAVEQMK